MQKRAFAERAEFFLIASMLLGILLVAQRWWVDVYRVGLAILVTATFLEIAVGNVPKDFGFRKTVVRVAVILAIIVLLFALGIFLVPYLSQLGR